MYFNNPSLCLCSCENKLLKTKQNHFIKTCMNIIMLNIYVKVEEEKKTL